MHKITAIVGRNGSGKTQLVERMRRELASDSVRYMAFRDTYGTNVDRAYYLQQRWNQHDIDDEMPMVDGKYIISLSSGELRKYQLRKVLEANPRLLILDNPFIGLDAASREELKALLPRLAEERGMHIVLVLSKTDETPDFIEEITDMDHDGRRCSLAEYRAQAEPVPAHVMSDEMADFVGRPMVSETTGGEVIRMTDVTIRYGERTILDRLNWTVRQGERWALMGRNGSGKSTLLSLVCADNPQSYACDIKLFGRQRGSGESIWDIKRRIGYVSPEMHRSYRQNLPAVRIVASGLKDTVGLYVRPNAAEYDVCRQWMRVFGVEALADRPFLQLSSGEQRLVLVARAFVKDPDLLILDEPLHGLDLWNRRLVKDAIEAYCRRPQKTLIMVTHYAEELPPCITSRLQL